MPFYAELRFFRKLAGSAGTESILLVYEAKGEALSSALERIPIRRLEKWRPGVDAATLAALKFLADTLGMPDRWSPDSSAQALLSCHTPFEAAGAARHRAFAIADTARGMIWIGRSLSVAEAPYLALEAFYQLANSGFGYSERAEAGRKVKYLEAHAPAEPGLSVSLALQYVNGAYLFGSPFDTASFTDGAFQHVIAIQEKSLRADEGFCLGYARLARYHSIREDFAQARLNLEKAGACREDIHYLAAKAIYHLKRKLPDSCRTALARLEEGDFPEKRYYPYEEIIQELAREEGNLEELEKSYQRLILRYPGSAQPYGNFASYLLGKYRFDEAAILCDKARGLGEYPMIYLDCKEAERKQKRYGRKDGLVEATRRWARQLDERGDPLLIRRERAGRLDSSGLGFLAMEDIGFLMARAPSPDLVLRKVRLLARLGEGSQARETCGEFAGASAASAALLLACGKAEYQAHHPEIAQNYLARSLAKDSAMGGAALYLGFLKGDSSGGAAEALRRDSTVAEAWAVLGLASLHSGKHAEAAAYFGSALAREPDNLAWHAWRGEALAKAGKPEKSLADLNQVLRRIRGHAGALRARVAAYRALGAHGLAWADFKQLSLSAPAQTEDSSMLREWVKSAVLDTALLSNDPVFSIRCGFTRNILEGKAIDRPDRLSLKEMRKRRVYLRMNLRKAGGKQYAFTYNVKDGWGNTMETGDLSVAPRTDDFTQWISYRFGQRHEAPGNWSFNLYRNGNLVVAETIRMDR